MFRSFARRVLTPSIFGLDISDLTAKFARIDARPGRALLDYFGEIELAPDLVVDGEIKDEAKLAAILGERLHAAGVKHRAVVAALPEEKSFVRLLEIPKMKLEDIAKAVRWEIEGIIPLPAEDMIYDFEVVSGPAFSQGHLDILVTAFPRTVVAAYEAALGRAGLLPVALELESQAITRALLKKPEREPPAIILDFGAVRTSLILFASGTIIFTKSIPLGGRDFEQAIAAHLGVNLQRARQLKTDIGLNAGYAQGKLWEALQPPLNTLTLEIDSSLRFYEDHPRRTHAALDEIKRIILCGGDANLIGLEKYLSLNSKMPVEIGNSFAGLTLTPGAIPPIPRGESLKYTTAIGLASRTI